MKRALVERSRMNGHIATFDRRLAVCVLYQLSKTLTHLAAGL
jgi:hypothetical protein